MADLDQKIIYLDQFTISNMHKIRAGRKLSPVKVHEFWSDFDQRISRSLKCHVAIFPPSNIHDNETTVSPFAEELKVLHDMFGGETSLKSTDEINLCQEAVFLEAFFNKKDIPKLDFFGRYDFIWKQKFMAQKILYHNQI